MFNRMIKNFPAVVMAAIIFVLAVMACARPAYAVTKVNDHPVVVVTTYEIADGFKFKPNVIYIERSVGVVTHNKGDGHVVGHKDWYISYRYKNHPKKGKKVISYFPLDNNADHEALSRYDFVKTKKGKLKMIHTS